MTVNRYEVYTRPCSFLPIEHIVKKEIHLVFIGGMWSQAVQWNGACERIQRNTVSDRVTFRSVAYEYPGHGHRGDYNLAQQDFESYVRDFAMFLRSLDKERNKYRSEESRQKSVIIGHSLGVPVAIAAAAKYPELVSSIIGLAHSAMHGCLSPMSVRKKFIRTPYVRALFGEPFEVLPEHANFIRCGSNAELGPESGHILRQITTGRIKVPRLKDLSIQNGIDSYLIFAKDDPLSPEELAEKIASYHGVEPLRINKGGHYAHLVPKVQDVIWSHVGNTLAEKACENKSSN